MEEQQGELARVRAEQEALPPLVQVRDVMLGSWGVGSVTERLRVASGVCLPASGWELALLFASAALRPDRALLSGCSLPSAPHHHGC